MKLDLSEIARTVGKRYHYTINEPPIVDDTIVCTEPIQGSIDFSNTGSLLIAKGSFKTAVQMECSRCLKTFSVPVSSQIDEQFEIAPTGEIEEETEPEAEVEEETESFFVDHVLDLTEMLRQNLVISLPIRPLCQEGCKGLCPSCGQNLNDAECECHLSAETSPFAELGKIWREKQGEEQEPDQGR